MPSKEEFIDMALTFMVATVVKEMVRDLDVTDDVLGREFHSGIMARLGTGAFSASVRSEITPARAMELAGGAARRIRRVAAMSTAAAIDCDAGASESEIGAFVHMSLLKELGQRFEGIVIPEFAYLLGRSYVAMCRRSGLPPDRWAEAFAESVERGHWAFRRR